MLQQLIDMNSTRSMAQNLTPKVNTHEATSSKSSSVTSFDIKTLPSQELTLCLITRRYFNFWKLEDRQLRYAITKPSSRLKTKLRHLRNTSITQTLLGHSLLTRQMQMWWRFRKHSLKTINQSLLLKDQLSLQTSNGKTCISRTARRWSELYLWS